MQTKLPALSPPVRMMPPINSPDKSLSLSPETSPAPVLKPTGTKARKGFQRPGRKFPSNNVFGDTMKDKDGMRPRPS